ncbi:YybH family protein [Gemmatimonas sp.]|uniref:YybH family protein n=1 Tax=Gemmatimonas sp. TaxID=1962908 RepID=UPI003982EB8E
MSALICTIALLLITPTSLSSELASGIVRQGITVALANRPPAALTTSIQPADDVARATAVLRAVFASAERGDLAALDTLYAGDSLTVVEGAGINRGWADYRDHHLGPELKSMKNFLYRPLEIVVRVSGQYAWATFRYDLKGEMNGRQLDNVGRGTAILERRGTGVGARWVVRHTQTSSRARRATDAPAS